MRIVLLLGTTTEAWDDATQAGDEQEAAHTSAICEGVLASLAVVLGKSVSDTRALILRGVIEILAKEES